MFRSAVGNIAAVLAMALLVTTGTGALLWLILGEPQLSSGSHGSLSTEELYDGIKIALTVVAGIGGVVALVIAYRRQRYAEAESEREDTKLYTERLRTAAEQLGAPHSAGRLAGVYALANLADDWHAGRQTCINILCAYLRKPYIGPDDTPAFRGSAGSVASETTEAAQLTRREEQQVRYSLIQAIGDHLREGATAVSWQGYNFNLGGAILDGGDLHGSTFSPGTRVSFDRTVFCGGAANFKGARFSGGEVSFTEAEFASGEVAFDGATFSGGSVYFDDARFSGGDVSFSEAVFSGGHIDFAGAELTGGTVNFHEATFSGSTVRFGAGGEIDGGSLHFHGAEFAGSDIDFDGTRLLNGEITFMNARFSSGTVRLDATVFAGGLANFTNARFSGSTVTFDTATFKGAEVRFYGSKFSAGEVLFPRAEFTGGQVLFGGAIFSGCKVDFAGAIFWGGPTFDALFERIPRDVIPPRLTASRVSDPE